MKIFTEINMIDNVYQVVVGVPRNGLTPAEREQVEIVGEQVIDVGGSFNGAATRSGDMSPTATSFALPSQQRRMLTEFPVIQLFSLQDYTDADIRAFVYKQTIEQRLQAARTAMMAIVPNFLVESQYTVSNSMPLVVSPVEQEGVNNLSNATSQITITFGQAFQSVPNSFIWEIYNNSADVSKELLTPYLISANTTTMVVGWSVNTNSGNYYLSWTAKIV